jgi:hypothetical protein
MRRSAYRSGKRNIARVSAYRKFRQEFISLRATSGSLNRYFTLNSPFSILNSQLPLAAASKAVYNEEKPHTFPIYI